MIMASLFGGKDGVHFFWEIGYKHYLFTHCPQGDMWECGQCSYDQEQNFGMWQDSVVACSDGFTNISFRLPQRVVLLTEVGAGSQTTSRIVSQ